VKRHDEFDRLLEGVARETEAECQATCLETLQSDDRVDPLFQDQFRRFFCNGFNLDAPFGRRHDDGLIATAIQGDTEVEFLFDVHSVCDQHRTHFLALRPGLWRFEHHAKNGICLFANLIQILGQLDAATFPATTCVDLGFDYKQIGSCFFLQLTCRFYGSVSGCRQNAFLDCNAVARKDVFCLILVDFH